MVCNLQPQVIAHLAAVLCAALQRALAKGALACWLSGEPGDPLVWSEQPAVMSSTLFKEQLALLYDGIREGHEPHRFIATQVRCAARCRPGGRAERQAVHAMRVNGDACRCAWGRAQGNRAQPCWLLHPWEF